MNKILFSTLLFITSLIYPEVFKPTLRLDKKIHDFGIVHKKEQKTIVVDFNFTNGQHMLLIH